MKYIGFRLDEQEYALEFTFVKNISSCPDKLVMPVENSLEDIMLGFSNFNNETYPIIDTRYLFYKQKTILKPKLQIIYLNEIGLLIDNANKMFDIENDEIQLLKEKIQNPFLKGFYNTPERNLIKILDIDKIENVLESLK